MQLSVSGIFGPPKDRATALAVLREVVASGINHIDLENREIRHLALHSTKNRYS
jgi:hypothetical protein